MTIYRTSENSGQDHCVMRTFFIATFTPAIIVAIERFHLDLIPRDLHEQLIKTHDTLAPFTIELLFVILLMQVIMDGSYRLPGNVIFAVTFIGTMLISDVATDVNLFHPVTIVIIGICYISSFPVLHRGLLSPIFFMRLSFIILAHFFWICRTVFRNDGFTFTNG